MEALAAYVDNNPLYVSAVGSVVVLVVMYVLGVLYYARHIDVKGRVVVITGCDTGFGRMLAEQLGELGLRVYALCLSDEAADQLDADPSGNVTGLKCDVTNDDDVQQAAEIVEDEAPEGVWAVVNNAGIGRGFFIEFCSMEDYTKTMDVNLFGMIRVTKAFIPMVKQCRGRFVNITSAAGLHAASGSSSYAASKFAAEGFTDALRREMMMFGVDVTTVNPGFHGTPIIGSIPKGLKTAIESHPELAEEYGPRFLKQHSKMTTMIDNNAADPQDVINVLVKAIRVYRPRVRYWIGADAYLIGLISKVMPEWALDRILYSVSPCVEK